MGTRVVLTALRDEDSDRLFEWINDRALVVRSAPWRPVQRDEHDAWFAAVRTRPDLRIFAIRLTPGDQLIGSCQLHSVDADTRSAELQIRIGENWARGRGHGREAVDLLLAHAFGEMDLQRVTLHVFASNEAALALYRAAGFREGPGDEETVIEGRRERVLRMSITRPERARRNDVARRLVAIHQPNFFPWLGFFDKLARCDVFVLLDRVQFPRTGAGNPLNRTQVLVAGRPHWITVPVRRLGSDMVIRDVLIDETRDWRAKTTKTLRMNYARSPAFGHAMALVEGLMACSSERLAALNEHAIRCLAKELALGDVNVVRSSDLEVKGTSTHLLVEITRAVGGTGYLAGGGAAGYQEDALFGDAGLELVPQRFDPPAYPQPTDEPVRGLSIIDALMQCGVEGTRALLSR
jgi:RimJ/RimL family protein N-acetyltransferase